jgi:hypothetical protein
MLNLAEIHLAFLSPETTACASPQPTEMIDGLVCFTIRELDAHIAQGLISDGVHVGSLLKLRTDRRPITCDVWLNRRRTIPITSEISVGRKPESRVQQIRLDHVCRGSSAAGKPSSCSLSGSSWNESPSW